MCDVCLVLSKSKERVRESIVERKRESDKNRESEGALEWERESEREWAKKFIGCENTKEEMWTIN